MAILAPVIFVESFRTMNCEDRGFRGAVRIDPTLGIDHVCREIRHLTKMNRCHFSGWRIFDSEGFPPDCDVASLTLDDICALAREMVPAH